MRRPSPFRPRAIPPPANPAEIALPGEARVADAAARSLAGHRRGLRSVLPFLGPAFVASVAYVDPGNFATNVAAGAAYGYLLMWVVLTASLMAMLIQTMSAKLGIATGMNLPEVCRARYSRRVSRGLWAQAELIAMATDLAEFLGAALGFNLLFGIPLFAAGVLTGVCSFAILALQARGARPLEIAITMFVGVILVGFAVQFVLADPSVRGIAEGLGVPRFDGTESVLLATGILGATVMPHVIYLHSALTQRRVLGRSESERRRIFHFERIDVVIAMSIAGGHQPVDAGDGRGGLPLPRPHRREGHRRGVRPPGGPGRARTPRSPSAWPCWRPACPPPRSARSPARW